MFLTATQLRELGACGRDVAKFNYHWPNGTELTKKVLDKCFRSLRFSIYWAKVMLPMSDDARIICIRTFANAEVEYDTLCTSGVADKALLDIAYTKLWDSMIEALIIALESKS